MYPLEHKTPHFVPYDVVRIKNTGTIAIVQETSSNTGQNVDIHQWHYSIEPLDPKAADHNAWYDLTELEYLSNIFEIIAANSKHPFSSSGYKLTFDSLRRAKS